MTRRGCWTTLAIVALVLGGAVAGGLWWRGRAQEQARVAQEARAEDAFSPVLDKMADAARQTPEYDIDKTIRTIFEVDEAVRHSDSLQDWLSQLGHQDYRGVAPDVLQARAETLEVLMDLYSRQVAVEDQQALWDFSSGMVLLSALSVVGVEGDVSPVSAGGAVSVDKEQAKALLEEMIDAQEEHARLTRDLREAQGRLMTASLDYSEVYYRYIDEWDRLAALRDRAWLAAWSEDWGAAESAADAAIAQAPMEREAHIVKAWAMIESGEADSPEGGAEVEALLSDLVEDHPDQSAPAFLLMGVLQARRGDAQGARLHLQQAAAYYPRQADSLTDMLDPYRARSWLRKSREGGWILELYKNTMLGAGYFSPDLQLARLAFERGDVEDGKQKVFDHFARRRAQQQWDYLLSDLSFCQDLLGEHYRAIFPADTYLDLVAKPALIGDKLNLSVRNRSDTTLHNATLILAVQFTDMHPSDYEAIVGGDTQPAVLAHETTSFGSVEVGMDLYGVHKGISDIVTDRAVLVSNEAVIWVDTEPYKLAEARDWVAEPEPAATPTPRPQSWAEQAAQGVLEKTRREATLQVDVNSLLKDDVVVRLPKELALLRPLFRLRSGEERLVADDNLIEGDHIELRFAGVGDLADKQAARFEIEAATPAGQIVLVWNQDVDGSFRLDDVELGGREVP